MTVINTLRRTALLSCALLPLTLAAQTAPKAPAGDDNSSQQQSLDRVIAIVDEDVILGSELQAAVSRAQENAARSKRELPPLDQFRRQIFDQLVLESLQLQIANRVGVRVSDTELNEALDRIAQQNNMTLEQFSQVMTQDGTSYAQAREQLRRELLIQRVQQGSVSERVQITDQEVENFLASAEGQARIAPQYHVLHALIPITDKTDPEQVKQFAMQLDTRAREGEDFNRVMTTAGPVKVQNSDLGWRTSDNLPSLLVDLVPTLKSGEVAEPLRSPSGYHIVKVVEVRGKGEIIQQTKARHILLKPSAIRTEAQCQQLAAELRQRILAGADFDALAKQYSEDIGSAMEGGELGWTNPGQLVGTFQTAMDNTPKGAISEPFHSRYGWHIVKVEDRRTQDVTDEMRHTMARNYLHEKKYQDELDAWLRRIRDEAFVDIKKI
ncbi:MAG: molecular chaperone SurA [Verrucomicrobiaceae bacterium]|nr:molecular chaperone SurA [Verrucomicrobiaceae bacterium]